MDLKLYSMKNDLLELIITPVRPNIKIAEIFFEEAWHPWHAAWEILQIKEFKEDFETVQNKIIEYYKAEKASCTLESGATLRKPGRAALTTSDEEWRLENCKITDCQIDEEKKTIVLDLWFDGVCYKSFVTREDYEKARAV